MDPLFAIQMLVVGVGVGVVSAALGIGGGVLMVPAFITFVDGMDMNTAKGSSSFIIIFVAAYNAYRMNRGDMRSPWQVAAWLAAGSIVGGLFGGWVTGLMSDAAVTWIFVALLAFAALRTFFLEPPVVLEQDVRSRQVPSIIAGFLGGLVGGATGTGGGAILVPLALWIGIVSNARVVALSNTVMIATAVAATLAHALSEPSTTLPWTYGLVNVAMAPLVLAGALAGAPIGRRINAMLSLPRRRVVMGLLLLVIAARLMMRAL